MITAARIIHNSIGESEGSAPLLSRRIQCRHPPDQRNRFLKLTAQTCWAAKGV
jgi:hypothetical protein